MSVPYRIVWVFSFICHWSLCLENEAAKNCFFAFLVQGVLGPLLAGIQIFKWKFAYPVLPCNIFFVNSSNENRLIGYFPATDFGEMPLWFAVLLLPDLSNCPERRSFWDIPTPQYPVPPQKRIKIFVNQSPSKYWAVAILRGKKKHYISFRAIHSTDDILTWLILLIN